MVRLVREHKLTTSCAQQETLCVAHRQQVRVPLAVTVAVAAVLGVVQVAHP